MNTIKSILSPIVLFIGALALMSTISCHSNAPSAGTTNNTYTIVMKHNVFEPSTMTVVQGSVIVFRNDDTDIHTATSDNGNWNTGDVKPGASYSVTLPSTGTFHYHCKYHGTMGMNGTITVTGNGSY